MFPSENTIYIIQYDYDLNEQEITIPAGCILDFQGGLLSNGTIVGDSTGIQANINKIFDINLQLDGSWNVDEWYTEWFGAKGDGITDDTLSFTSLISSFKENISIKLLSKTYCVSQLDLSECKYIEINGSNGSTTHNAGAFTAHTTTLKAISNIDVFIVARAKERPNINSKGFGFTFSNFNIDGNGLANTGLLCAYEVYCNNIQVVNCFYGIEIGELAYPVKFRYVYCRWNQYGLYLHGPDTTVVDFKDCEFQFNTKWGIYITSGVNIHFTDCLLQANWVGGIKIEQIPKEETKNYWLQNIYFDNLYTEGNGRRDVADDDYEGNYTLYIKGLTTTQAYANKIAYILFVNCNFNKSSNGQVYYIEGTYGVKSINCNIPIVPDRNINMYSWDYFSRLETEIINSETVNTETINTETVNTENLNIQSITFPTNSQGMPRVLSTYLYGWTIVRAGTYGNKNFTISDTNANSLYTRIGNLVYLQSSISYTDKNNVSGNLTINEIPFNVSKKIIGIFIGGLCRYIDINGEVKNNPVLVEPGANYAHIVGI